MSDSKGGEGVGFGVGREGGFRIVGFFEFVWVEVRLRIFLRLFCSKFFFGR